MKARQACILTTLVLALVPAVARAVPSPNGATFKVSNCDDCRKRSPSVAGVPAGTAAGTFLVTWESTSPADLFGISARFFTKAGAPKAADFLVNKDIAPQQQDPSVGTDAAGNSVVAWSVKNGVNLDIMVQRYKAGGAANGAAVMVNVDDPAAPVKPLDIAPAVAVAPNGSFVVAWARSTPPSATSPGTLPAVMVRRYSNAGAPVGPPVQLSTGLALGTRPDVCIDPTGRAVVAWTNVNGFFPFQPNLKGVSVRRVSAAGAALETEIAVAKPLAADSSAAVICGTAGAFVVSWSTNLAPAVDGSDIVAQRFSALAKPVGTPFRLNSVTAGDQTQPAMMSDAAGNFTAVWQSHQTTTKFSDFIMGRRFLASATADGADFTVHARATQIEERPVSPDIANLGAAGFVVVWTQGSSGLQAQRYKLTK